MGLCGVTVLILFFCCGDAVNRDFPLAVYHHHQAGTIVQSEAVFDLHRHQQYRHSVTDNDKRFVFILSKMLEV